MRPQLTPPSLHIYPSIYLPIYLPIYLAGSPSLSPFPRFDAAEALLRKALMLQPHQCPADTPGPSRLSLSRTLHALGTICRLRGDFAKAQASLDACLAIREGLVKEGGGREEELAPAATADAGAGAGAGAGAPAGTGTGTGTGTEKTAAAASKAAGACVAYPTSASTPRPREALWLLADTLHELGILAMRTEDAARARALLARSLAIKESQGPCLGDTTLSASLYQLSIIATAEKRYDEAEALLHRALQCGGPLPTSAAAVASLSSSAIASSSSSHASSSSRPALVSRAACIQQLGRVSLRRGRCDAALGYLTQSLVLYTQAYGCTAHINVAAVQVSLSSLMWCLFTCAVNSRVLPLPEKEGVFGKMPPDSAKLSFKNSNPSLALLPSCTSHNLLCRAGPARADAQRRQKAR